MQPTLIIEARLEVGVTLSIKLLTPDEFWTTKEEDVEEDAFVVVVWDEGSATFWGIGVEVSERWLLLLLLLNVLSDE